LHLITLSPEQVSSPGTQTGAVQRLPEGHKSHLSSEKQHLPVPITGKQALTKQLPVLVDAEVLVS